MEAVCSQIPSTLEGADLDVLEYHRQCYQGFTENIDLQQTDNGSQPSTSQRHHSPWKQSRPNSTSSHLSVHFVVLSTKLPASGCSSPKTCIMFTMTSAWDSLEPQAEELGKENLCRIRGFDLFPIEAKLHHSWRMEFTNRYRKQIRVRGPAARTSQTRPVSAPVTMKPSTHSFSSSRSMLSNRI